MMVSTTAPSLDGLRVDIVGSFLRPPDLKRAGAAFAAGARNAAELHRLEDAAIQDLIAQEERHGLPIVSDGEFRRRHFMESFADVAGMEPWRAVLLGAAAIKAPEDAAAVPVLEKEHGNEVRCPVTQRLALVRNAPLDEYRFAATVAKRPATVTLIGPDRIGQRYAYEESLGVYPGGLDEFLDDVVRVEREIVAGLIDAGCRYVHIDGPGYTAFVDDDTLAAMRGRGEDPMKNLERSIRADNAVVRNFPGTTFGIHMCRGNSRSQWHRKGSYEAIAERLFSTLEHRRLLLEYDDERSGDFAPLRFVPKGKVVVLGLITTKRGELESIDALMRRIDEASTYLPLEQLALSPQCGFASGLAGNQLSEAEQWRKVDLLVETARRVWGG
jgi:5-methyltetrahydropteroyltriglutamate--homocysteine methyltransferase